MPRPTLCFYPEPRPCVLTPPLATPLCPDSILNPCPLASSGKQMIETYFDFRLYRLWKSRQHSKLLDFEDVL